MHYRPPAERGGNFLRKRFFMEDSSLAVIISVFGLIGLYVFYRCFIMPIIDYCKRRAARRAAKHMKQDDHFAHDHEMAAAAAMDNSDDIYREFNVRALRNLYIRAQKEFELFRTMFNAISYDQEKLTDDYAKEFKKRLKQRILDLEDTIDVHLNLIGGLERFMDKNYLYKLAVLDCNEEKIPMKDELSMRLIDITQSYQIYDSLEF